MGPVTPPRRAADPRRCLVDAMGCLSNCTVNRPFQALLDLVKGRSDLPWASTFAPGQWFAGDSDRAATHSGDQRLTKAPPRLSPDEVAKLVTRYQEGAKVRELAEEFGVHKHTASAHLARQGIPTRTGGRVVDEAAALEVIRLYADGQTMDAIAAHLGITQSTVSQALSRENSVAAT